ncbi:bifunctional lysylphosphatidylglycerol flippase/synthetase MprF [Kiritimatiellota bacterium B12222]|nr:bifunctional lysylphosphatidylglycerol flippase/synthetase MprF [Kiritimatiellota bacterium B12222]
MNKKIKTLLLSVFVVAMLCLSGWLLSHELATFSYKDLKKGLADIPRQRILLGIGVTVFSYWILTFYDLLGIRYLGKKLSYPKTLLVSFSSYVLSYNLGMSSLGGTALRFRLYSNWGFGALEVTKLVAFCALSFWGGFFVTCGVGFTWGHFEIPEDFILSLFEIRFVGVVLLLWVLGYLISCGLRKSPLKIRNWSFQLPTLRMACGQFLIGGIDIMLATLVFYILLPEGAPSFSIFLGIFLLAIFAGMISHVPGGMGVFDAVILLFLTPWIDTPDIVGVLLVYRTIYYFLPLALALGLLGIYETIRWSKQAKPLQSHVKNVLPIIVPPLLSMASLVSGAMLLFTGATPSFHGRLAWLENVFPLSVIEFSHFAGSLVGVLLLFLARGIYRQIDSAYVFSMILFLVGAVMAFTKGEFGAGGVLVFLALVLWPCRHHFYRQASLFAQPLSLKWLLTYIVIIGTSLWLVSFSYKHVQYSNELWWQFALNGDASRSLRAIVGAGILMGLLILARMVAPVKAKPDPVTPEELQEIEAIVAASSVTKANLALLGDKSFLMSPSRKSFIMYAVEGGSWIAMGDPVGDVSEFEELVWTFRELSDQHNDRAAFYGISTEHLPLYLDAGFSLTKIGEEAVVPLVGFSLEGPKRKGLRQTVSRLERDGCSFEFIPCAQALNMMPQLKQISDEWLGDKNSSEKGFSLGFFSEEYLRHYDFAVVKVNAEIVAFTNIWKSGNHEELSIDLMRFTKNSPSGCMEYLFINLLLWGAENGYRSFSLGAAPLAGLDDHPLAPMWSRIGAQIYEHGEHFYNFRGLRAYKEKFSPDWRPRYLATIGGLRVPQVLTHIATLVAGGWKEMLFR